MDSSSTTQEINETTLSASDLKVVDVDTHLSEPWDLWTKRAPEGYEDRVPQVKMVEGEYNCLLLVRGRRRPDLRSHPQDRRRQVHVRDGLPAPDLPLPEPG